ncbi:hypothetical protein D3OALGA1CA_3549 [Olavius algarvensis associated proteobacterium Delta 3]|nr:hypothetical protein D3OALGB2SA_2322 [Olavius algarvensis associated proteobacterium Delta 3]CAB5136106.1 hypothetical protein D3OALGA1CA_3549 [Olavius algarvensis associated proteobacterium Delta 3]
MLRKTMVICMMLVITVPAAQAVTEAPGPMQSLQKPVEQVLQILTDPRYNNRANIEEQKEKLWAIVGDVFDFEAIARGTLKRNRWKSFTPQQRSEFTDIFTRFLGNNYFNQIQGKLQNERIIFLSEVMKTEKKALVKTKIIRKAVEIPVDYSMWKRQGKWRIYNVHVEGTSLLGNYRNEFERVLRQDPPERLIEMLREKVETLTAETTEGN